MLGKGEKETDMIRTCWLCLQTNVASCELESDSEDERKKQCPLTPTEEKYPIIDIKNRALILSFVRKFRSFILKYECNKYFVDRGGYIPDLQTWAKKFVDTAVISPVADIGGKTIVFDNINSGDVVKKKRGRPSKELTKNKVRNQLVADGIIDDLSVGIKKRGRPMKEIVGAQAVPVVSVPTEKKKRGRPRKEVTEAQAVPNPSIPVEKKKRGRPRKSA